MKLLLLWPEQTSNVVLTDQLMSQELKKICKSIYPLLFEEVVLIVADFHFPADYSVTG